MKAQILKYTLSILLFLITIMSLTVTKGLLFFVAIFFIIVGLKEFRNMLAKINIYPIKFLPEIISIIVALFLSISQTPYQDLIEIFPTIMIGVILTLIICTVKNKTPYLQTVFSTIACILLPYSLMYMIKLTHLTTKTFPPEIILIYVLTILTSNLVASILDKKFEGKKLLLGNVDSKRTIIGAVGHLTTSVVFFTILSLLMIRYNILFVITIGLIISVFAQLGTLTLSAIKKECEVEHTGAFFLNNGGFLEKLDSFIFSAPILFYFLMLIALIFQSA